MLLGKKLTYSPLRQIKEYTDNGYGNKRKYRQNLPQLRVRIVSDDKGIFVHLCHVFIASAEEVEADIKLHFVEESCGSSGIEVYGVVELLPIIVIDTWMVISASFAL